MVKPYSVQLCVNKKLLESTLSFTNLRAEWTEIKEKHKHNLFFKQYIKKKYDRLFYIVRVIMPP